MDIIPHIWEVQIEKQFSDMKPSENMLLISQDAVKFNVHFFSCKYEVYNIWVPDWKIVIAVIKSVSLNVKIWKFWIQMEFEALG